MLVAFPTGRVAPGLERTVVLLGWIAAVILAPLSLLVVERPGKDCEDCPDNVLLVWSNETAADRGRGVRRARARSSSWAPSSSC